jgi:outer membrane protein TolC
MRWIRGAFGTLLILALISGCKQRFLSDTAAEDATLMLTNQLESDPSVGVTPISLKTKAPPTVDYPDRKPRFMTLQEAVAIALETGRASGRVGIGQGITDDSLAGLQNGPLNNQTDKIRVLSYNPSIAFSSMEASAARFDAKWTTNVNWVTQDVLQNGLANFTNGQQVFFNSSIYKAFASGGFANVTLGGFNAPGGAAGNANFTNLANPPLVGNFRVINPLYDVPLSLGVEQPLWRDFGVGINQLLNQVAPIQGITLPAAANNFFQNSRTPLFQGPNFTGLQTVGILVARLNFDQSRAEFQRQIHILLVNTEVAYWNLYKAYGTLYTWDVALRASHQAWAQALNLLKAGAKEGSLQKYYPVQAQYEEFRNERLKALGQVLDAERNLRGILGLPVEDDTRIVPVTPPTLAPYQPNWEAALEDALALRPELVLARGNLRNAQFNLEVAKNFLKPDLRFVGTYTPVGFGTTLTGNGQLIDGGGAVRGNNALRSLSSNHFDNWTAGLVFNVPLGFRLENAQVRAARLGLAAAYHFLQDQEEKAQIYLYQHYSKVTEWYRRIEVSHAERLQYDKAVSSYWELIKVGTASVGDLQLLDFQRRLALARAKEFEAIAEYNNSLARFEFAKGTILEHDNVSIAEGALPRCVEGRAVENERQQTDAFILRERPKPLIQPGWMFEEVQKQGKTPEALPDPTDIMADEPPKAGPASQPSPPATLPDSLSEKSNSSPYAPVNPTFKAPESKAREVNQVVPAANETTWKASSGSQKTGPASTIIPVRSFPSMTPAVDPGVIPASSVSPSSYGLVTQPGSSPMPGRPIPPLPASESQYGTIIPAIAPTAPGHN